MPVCDLIMTVIAGVALLRFAKLANGLELVTIARYLVPFRGSHGKRKFNNSVRPQVWSIGAVH